MMMSSKKKPVEQTIDPVLAAMDRELERMHKLADNLSKQMMLVEDQLNHAADARDSWVSAIKNAPVASPTPPTPPAKPKPATPKSKPKSSSKPSPKVTLADVFPKLISPMADSRKACVEPIDRTLVAGPVQFKDLIDTYCADKLAGKAPHTLPRIYEGLHNRPLICIGTGGDECWAYEVVPAKEWKRPTVANTLNGYIGVPFKCKGKAYVISGPHLHVVLEKDDWPPAELAEPATQEVVNG
jgi:hypothetical protein